MEQPINNCQADVIMHPWILSEAQGDVILLDLLVLQDDLYHEWVGLDTNDAETKQSFDATQESLARAIIRRQQELGIDPLEGPPQQT